MSKRVENIQEAKTHLSKLLREAEAGEQITIARAGKAIALLVRVEAPGARRWGIFRGEVHADPHVFDPIDSQARSESAEVLTFDRAFENYEITRALDD